MRAVDLIIKKRDGKALQDGEIDFLIQGFVRGEIPDYQIASILMAIFFRGMNLEETVSLTKSMVESGKQLDLSSLPGPTVDKHSTGGVGDKVSLALVPLLSACGLFIAKMSGRGLGHTGGTIDKLESIPGFKTDLSLEELLAQVKEVGCAIVSQTPELVPADGKLYALRDVTGTVESIPLIASSVMSKKIAGGASNILIDVKCGRGAFMKTLKEARDLSRIMVEIGTRMKRKVTCLITPMDEPLGKMVGNALEVKEAVETLKGTGPSDFTNSVLELAGELLFLSGKGNTPEEGKEIAREVLNSGGGLFKFKQMLKAQGGDERITDEAWRLPGASFRWVIPSKAKGFVKKIDAFKIGKAAMILGGGREKKGDPIDYGVGVELLKKSGDFVTLEEPLAVLHVNNRERIKEAQDLVEGAFSFSKEPVEKLFKPLARISNA
ncbi:MAG: thymidine phosphorylase [Caldiserica bacterium]|jgi:pyrimidine-nucleoside phosphorylase|nr:thymidine phosphorylase [Caldisericota bacterium]MDH7562692.1 thymidine phosphorylase [Caldisericota bacterium]